MGYPIDPPTLVTTSSLPRFKQIEGALRQRIVNNEWTPGIKLPSEAELMAEFGVSRITVRQSLASLLAEGLIETVHGKGSFVSRPAGQADLGPLTGFYDYMRARGHEAHGKLLSTRLVTAPAVAADALRAPPGSKLLSVTTLKSVAGTPVAVGVTMAPEALMRAILEHDLENHDALMILEARLGYRLKYLHTESAAIPATSETARRLKVEPGEPLLRIRFTPHDIDERPLAFSEFMFRGDKFTYKACVRR
ncbi:MULTISPECIES: GntR family transcriptional regulator [Cupriavidus]|uniref:GntR family transcriptional regulator n=1 Tax=Cupriavidus taiwanensis TaxID=164546 RepID=UPI0015748834|nr:GntR family transcriptional regulator [Cupriavidus taiwanensis]NSX14342.1 GntR family transcriptional regulator [Cupriavidus taiwanensis]